MSPWRRFLSHEGPSLVALLCLTLATCAEEPIRLREAFPAGYQYRVSTRVELSGEMTLPPEKNQPAPRRLPVSGSSAIDYDERILDPGTDGQVQKTIRIYRRIDFRRKVDDRPQESSIRPAVRRLVIVRLKNIEVPFSPDGPLTWGEIDLVRTDVFTPALAGLLPDKAVTPGQRWTANKKAIQELTDMEKIDEGDVECRFEQITDLNQRRHARIAFAGTVRGINEDGPNRQQLDGYLFFDLQSNHISYLSLKGISFLLDKNDKPLGRIEGRFVLTRQANPVVNDLTDQALKGVELEPSANNTLLLYENADLSIHFLHPRRWRVAGVHGRQIALDEANGSGLMVTVEATSQVPSGAQFLAEARDYLLKQQAKLLRTEQLQSLQPAPRELQQFALEVEIGGQRVLMDYFVVRQAPGGATFAARLLPADLSALRKEVEQIARSVVIDKRK
jgi:hypothetical protein